MDNLGRYQLLEKLGQGGMGIVYRAFDTLLQRVVAVKVISASIEGNPELRDRFFREARAAGQLSHPNIITIYDLGEYENQPYLAMEYLEGQDLQQRLLRPERMGLQHKLQLAIELCGGLEFAHKHGVVHRDIKPANVFITDGGVLKILDFGLARLVSSQLTQSNMMMGTINYMAPEQVRGERADHRADIFSTGVVLYELFGGRKAFEGDSFASTLYKILQEVPRPLGEIDSSIPPHLAAIVDRAMAKPRDERHQSMGELLRELVVYRERFGLYPAPGGLPVVPAPGGVEVRGPAGAWVGLRQTDSGTTPSPEIVTGAYSPTPAPSPAVEPTPIPASATPAPAPGTALPRSRRRWPLVVGAAVLPVALIGTWMVLSRPETPPPAAATPAAPAVNDAALRESLADASQALQRGDHAKAIAAADAVLRGAPDHAEARRVRAEAAGALEAIENGIRKARDLFAAGRFEDAGRAAGDVLTVAPQHAEARQIMSEAAAKSRGRGADEARRRMATAKTAATSANAAKLAPASYRVALEVERDALRLQQRGEFVQATGRFYEASGLFHSAQLAAQSAAAAAAGERERTAAPDRTAREGPEAPREPSSSPPPRPATDLPAAPVVPLGGAPGKTPGTPAPPPAAPPAAVQAPSPLPPPAPSADVEVREVLARYEAALEARSLDSIRKLWPGLSGAQLDALRTEFLHASRIEVDIGEPRIEVKGPAATVTFVRNYELLTTDGQRLQTRTRTEMTLRRLDGTWVVQQIRFEPAR
jgi:serine/threonine-protein kinase